MSSYLTHLKRTKHHHSCRWIVKYDNNNRVREVKLVYNPVEYRTGPNARSLHTIKGLIKILENERSISNS
jgi:hypothetical protein|tara:strand:- start:2982 stop:3191 length:210 start_codon:yes stop_codon:yes gene_type:complete